MKRMTAKSNYIDDLLKGKDERIKTRVKELIGLIFDNSEGTATITAELLAHLIVDSMEKMKKDDSEI